MKRNKRSPADSARKELSDEAPSSSSPHAPSVEIIDPEELNDAVIPQEDSAEIQDGETEILQGPIDIETILPAAFPAASSDYLEDPNTSAEDDSTTDSTSTSLAPLDPLQRYLAEIRHISTLTREEEHELAVRYFKNNDQDAGYRLVLANLRLVVMVAREYQRNVSNILDLVQEGNIGLLEAVKQYDPFRGIRFPSYAVYWIRAYMLRFLINNLRLVKIGTTQAQRKLFFNLQKEKERLEAEGFIPEAKLLAERLMVKESEVKEMEQRLALPDLSVDAPLTSRGSDDTSQDLHGILADSSMNAEERVIENQFSNSIRLAVEEFSRTVDEKERAILKRRLFTEEPQTLQEIADEFHLSRERIRQIENRLKERLKSYLSKRLGLSEDGEVQVGEAQDSEERP